MNFKEYIRPGKGAADISPLLLNAEAYAALIDRLVELFPDQTIDKVACIEARGFLLGSALAYKMRKGLIPLRKAGALKNETYSAEYQDYTGQTKTLEILTDAIQPDENILIVDDWCETGGAIQAAIELVEKSQGNIVGIGVLMDDSSEEFKTKMVKYNYRFIDQTADGDNF